MSEENKEILEEEDWDGLVYLCDDDGNEIAYEFLDEIEYEGNLYLVLISADEDDDQVIILRSEVDPEDEENESLYSVDNDEVENAVYALFKERNKGFYNFAD